MVFGLWSAKSTGCVWRVGDMKQFVRVACLVLAFFVLVTAKSDPKKKLKRYRDECKTEVQATNADVKAFFNDSQELLTATAKCFAGCFYEKNKIIKDGAFSRKKYDKLIDRKYPDGAKRTQALEALTGCETALVGIPKDRCQVAPVLRRCIPRIFGKKEENEEDDD